jgi:glycosyltransferase involved in cell wall biosynthesis
MLTPWSLTQSRIKKTLYLPVERRNVRGAAALHFFTSEEGEQSARWGSPAKTLILPNGVPLVHYDRPGDREWMERLYPVLRGKVVLLFLGRLHPGKGLDILIPAFSRLLTTRPECTLVVCGPDDEFGVEVEQMVRTLGLSEAVLRTGFVVGEAKRALLGGADVFVLPSRHEGDSVAIKEAMQAGLPLIITSQCGFPDAAKAGVGIVVEQRIDELAQGMERLVADLNLRQEMGIRGRSLVESIYVWDIIIPRLLEVYQNLVDDSHRIGPRRTDPFSCKPGRGQ